MEDMELELEAAMKTYFSMDDAALADFLSLSETKKALALVEVLRHD